MASPETISADEALALFREHRPGHSKEVGGGVAVMKAATGVPKFDKATRSARFVMTSQSVDRYGDIVMTEGLNLDQFNRNPVVLLFHSSRDWPVGKWANLEKQVRGRPPRMEGDAILLPKGAPAGLGEKIDETEWMLAHDGIRATSIGFMPKWGSVERRVDEKGKFIGLTFHESEMLECSIVAIPANPDALAKDDGGPTLARELVENVLDNWARSPQGVIMPRDAWEKAYGASTKTTVVVPTPAAEAASEEEIEMRFFDRNTGVLKATELLAKGEPVMLIASEEMKDYEAIADGGGELKKKSATSADKPAAVVGDDDAGVDLTKKSGVAELAKMVGNMVMKAIAPGRALATEEQTTTARALANDKVKMLRDSGRI